MKKLISFDLIAEMGFLKKPDINEKIYLTYNILHKPALLGIMGAILGLKGYQENSTAKKVNFPEYYLKLKHIPVGVEPLGSDNGNFAKTNISYNNTTGTASKEEGGNLIINEQTLINPSFRVYLLLDTNEVLEKKLYESIKKQEAEFLPYMGKNDFSIWWDKDQVKEYQDFESFTFDQQFKVKNLFRKTEAITPFIAKALSYGMMNFKSRKKAPFTYFERLPVSFHEKLCQYLMGDFVFSNASFDKEMPIENTEHWFQLEKDSNEVVQLC